MPFVRAAKLSDIPPGQMRPLAHGDGFITIANVEGSLYAFDSVCTHAAAWLHEGFLDGHEVTCPVHFGAYDVRTGQGTMPPAYVPLQTYPVRVTGDDIEIDLPVPATP